MAPQIEAEGKQLHLSPHELLAGELYGQPLFVVLPVVVGLLNSRSSASKFNKSFDNHNERWFASGDMSDSRSRRRSLLLVLTKTLATSSNSFGQQ